MSKRKKLWFCPKCPSVSYLRFRRRRMGSRKDGEVVPASPRLGQSRIIEGKLLFGKLGHQKYPTILHSISPIDFPQLTKLVLRNDGIESVECMHRISCPLLTHLWIDDNFITSVSSLFKGCFNLTTLRISKWVETQAITLSRIFHRWWDFKEI